MSRTDAAWIGFWVGFGILDYAADRRGKSLSCSTRALFRTHHPIGRAVFSIGFVVGGVILHHHIVGARQ